MKYDYYAHRSGGKIFDYFGGVGYPKKVSPFLYYFLKCTGYVTSKLLKGTPPVVAVVNKAIQWGAHPSSMKVAEILQEWGCGDYYYTVHGVRIKSCTRQKYGRE